MTNVLRGEYRTGTSAQEAVRKWLSYIGRFTARTQQHYRMVILRFSDPKTGYLPDDVASLTPEHIDRYLAKVLEKHTPRTANAHLTVIKAFCRFCSERLDLPNPATKVRMFTEQPPIVRVLSEKELQKVLSVCRPLEKDVIVFLTHTALRAAEFQSLTWGCINLELKSMSIVGKGRKRRIVPLSNTACQILTKYSKLDTIDFVKSYSKRNALYSLCKRLSKKAGLPVFGPHTLRRYCATTLAVKHGVPIPKISKLLGHSSTRTTELYLRLMPSDLQGVTDCLDL